MQPNNPQHQNQPPQDYSIDYLDQIAAPAAPTRRPNKLIIIISAAGAFLLLTLVLGLIFIGGGSSPASLTDTYIRLQSLKQVSEAQHPALRDNVLRSYNSAFTLQLSSAIGDLGRALEENDIKTDDLPSSANDTQEAYSAALNQKFEEAALNLRLDRTYAREMTYEIDVLQSMITAIKTKKLTPATQTFVDQNESNFEAISNNFNQFSGAK